MRARTLTRTSWLLSLAALGACSADADERARGSQREPEREQAGAPEVGDEHGAPPWTPPAVSFPAPGSSRVLRLSEVGLYTEIESETLAPDLIAYEPRYALWSDGADKRRWLRLPAGATIDSSDPEHLRFPPGTVLFKEFSRAGKRLETRVIARVGVADEDTFMGTFLWQEDGADALLVRDGPTDVLGSDHDLPTETQCGTCHGGEPGKVLGFSAVQIAGMPPALFSQPLPEYVAQGGEQAARALGYLHANCGHCHNPHGSARSKTPMNLRLALAEPQAGTSTIERETIGVPLFSFTATDLRYRVVAGAPDESGLLARMLKRNRDDAMPPIGTKHVDEAGIDAVRAWITGLAPPR